MSTPTGCRFAHDDGAYVLGALSPAERLEFERHLPGCEECTRSVRELAGLPGLLGRIDPAVLEQTDEAHPVPDTLLPALAGEVSRTERRRRTVGLALAAAAVAAIVGLGVAVLQDEPPDQAGGAEVTGAAVLTMEPVGDEPVPVTAQLTMEPVAWGTKLGLTCTYDTSTVEYELPPEVDYWLVVHTRDGRTEKVGSWRSIDGRTMQFTAGTAADRDEIDSVEVRAPGGRVVLALTA